MVCGSCAVQHLGSGTYQTWKQEQVVQTRRAGLGDVTVGALRTWTPGTRRADFVLRKTGRLIAGFHERGSNRIVEVAECPIATAHTRRNAVLRFLFDGALEPGQSVNCVVTELVMDWICFFVCRTILMSTSGSGSPLPTSRMWPAFLMRG